MSVEKIKCKKCGYELFPSDKKCDKCGTSVDNNIDADDEIEIVSLDDDNESSKDAETLEKTEIVKSDIATETQKNTLDTKLVDKSEKDNTNEKVASSKEKKSYKGVIIGTISAVIVIALISILIPNFSKIFHRHTWVMATCETPTVCSECGKIDGEALGHDFLEATCEEPSTCSRCKMTRGEALGHVYEDTPCDEKKICTRCGEESVELAGHLIEIGICEKCGVFQGEEKLFDAAKCWHDVVEILNGVEPEDLKEDIEDTVENSNEGSTTEEDEQVAIEKAATEAENKSKDDMYNDICTRIYRYQNAIGKLEELVTICDDCEPLQNIKTNTQSLIESIPVSYIKKEEEEMLAFIQNENTLLQMQRDINDEIMTLIGAYLETSGYQSQPNETSLDENSIENQENSDIPDTEATEDIPET